MNKTLKAKLKYLLPVPIKKLLKFVLYTCEDFVSTLKGTRDKDYPPKRLNFVGSSEFKKVGAEFLGHFSKAGGLEKDNTVLDIGCGIGRIAIPLTKYLNSDAHYHGFDIDKRGVTWCQKNISNKHPNFHFDYVDIYNKYYNKKGKIKSEEFEFPYKDETFDFIFATSVFTHMLPKEVLQYFKEINRVLKKGGTLFITFFSLDKEALENITAGRANAQLTIPFDENKTCFYSHKNVPEAEIGYLEDWITDELKKVDCAHNLKVHHGNWDGRKEALSYQDIFISMKA